MNDMGDLPPVQYRCAHCQHVYNNFNEYRAHVEALPMEERPDQALPVVHGPGDLEENGHMPPVDVVRMEQGLPPLQGHQNILMPVPGAHVLAPGPAPLLVPAEVAIEAPPPEGPLPNPPRAPEDGLNFAREQVIDAEAQQNNGLPAAPGALDRLEVIIPAFVDGVPAEQISPNAAVNEALVAANPVVGQVNGPNAFQGDGANRGNVANGAVNGINGVLDGENEPLNGVEMPAAAAANPQPEANAGVEEQRAVNFILINEGEIEFAADDEREGDDPHVIEGEANGDNGNPRVHIRIEVGHPGPQPDDIHHLIPILPELARMNNDNAPDDPLGLREGEEPVAGPAPRDVNAGPAHGARQMNGAGGPIRIRGAHVECPTCRRRIRLRDIELHMHNLHPNLRHHRVCRHCRRLFPNFEAYDRHMREEHNEVD